MKVRSIWLSTTFKLFLEYKKIAEKCICSLETVEFCTRSFDGEAGNSDCCHESDSGCQNADGIIFGAPDDDLTDSIGNELSSDRVTSDIKAEFDNPAIKKRKFHHRCNGYADSSIEIALDEENYEPIDYSHAAIENLAVPLEKKKHKKSFGKLNKQRK